MKIKKIAAFGVALIVIALGVWACERNNNDPVTPHQSEKFIAMSSSNCLALNPSNPFDSVGIMHNFILDSVLPCATISDCVASSNSLISSYYGQYLIGFIMPSVESVSLLLGDTSTWFEATVDSLQSSNLVKAYLHELFDIITDTTDTTYVDYCVFKSKIVVFENAVTNNNILTTNEKAQILSASSVARHSGYYWMDEFSEDNNKPGPIYEPMGKKWWKKFLRVLGIVACDVAGGVVGGATMVSIGYTHPFAVGCGVVTGAVTTSSAAAGLK
jgi:hypothetical protein